MNYVVIFAGGTGTRMGAQTPKQFLKIKGRSIISYTISAFEESKQTGAIIVVCLASYISKMQAIIDEMAFKKVVCVIPGGNSALESQFLGLTYIFKNMSPSNDSTVTFHDGVRPFITPDFVDDCILDTKKYGSAIAITPAIETISKVSKNNEIIDIIPRKECYITRAPQCYFLQTIFRIFKKNSLNLSEYVDSASLYHASGFKLHTKECDYSNIKITTQNDFELAKFLITKYEKH